MRLNPALPVIPMTGPYRLALPPGPPYGLAGRSAGRTPGELALIPSICGHNFSGPDTARPGTRRVSDITPKNPVAGAGPAGFFGTNWALAGLEPDCTSGCFVTTGHVDLVVA